MVDVRLPHGTHVRSSTSLPPKWWTFASVLCALAAAATWPNLLIRHLRANFNDDFISKGSCPIFKGSTVVSCNAGSPLCFVRGFFFVLEGVPSIASAVGRDDRGGDPVQQDGTSSAQGACSCASDMRTQFERKRTSKRVDQSRLVA